MSSRLVSTQPYHALRPDPQPSVQHSPPDTLATLLDSLAAPQFLVDEAAKLEDLKSALWQAFNAAPAAVIPASLLEFACVYTSTVRLQLSLLTYAPAKNPATPVAKRSQLSQAELPQRTP